MVNISFSLETVFNVFKPILAFLIGAFDWFTMGTWDAYTRLVSSYPLIGRWNEWLNGVIGDYTGVDEFLNQFSMLSFSLGSGVVIILLFTIIGWSGDKVGL